MTAHRPGPKPSAPPLPASALTEEQIDRLTVRGAEGSPVLCLVCAEQAGIVITGKQVPADKLRAFRSCMVVPTDRWKCPRCSSALQDGRAFGRCPCCNQSRWARRKQWVYVVECQCVETAAQRKAHAERDKARAAYYEREEKPIAERTSAREEFAAHRAEATACLDDMPDRRCNYPANALPYNCCHACPRFGDGSAPKQRVGKPMSQADFASKPNWKDSVQMTDVVFDDDAYAALDEL